MFHYLKADCYRIRKERLSGISALLLLVFSILFAYMYREDHSADGLAGALTAASSLLPLFFVTPAKIFFGEDFTNRTINNLLIKSQNRFKIFVYKWVASLSLSLIYVITSYLVITVAHYLLSGSLHIELAGRYLLYQLPLYLVIVSLCGIIFNFFDRIYQSYMVYILLAMLFDQLFSLMMTMLFETTVFNPYMMFSNLGKVDVMGPWMTKTVLAAIIFSVIYAVTSFGIFAKREFK